MADTFPVNFPAASFKYPEHVNQRALNLLQLIRTLCGVPMTITGDWRPPGFVPTGGSNSSLHFKGHAFDIRSKNWDARTRGLVECAIWKIAASLHGTPEAGMEVEWVLSGPQEHLHVGFFLDGRADKLILLVK